jgi:hypothetical protein
MKSDTHLDESPALPESIVQALRQLIRRARHLMVLRGVCASCAAGLGAFLVIMLIDAGFTLLARWPRWLMTVMAYAAWAGALFWFLIRPLARSFTLTGIARLIEAHHPELQERLSSVVQLLSSRDVAAIRGSEVLIGALTEEAVRDAVTLRPKHEISFRGAMPFAIAAGLVLTLLAALWLVKPRQTRFLLARAAAPFLNLPNVYAADLVVEPGDALIASGSRLRISIRTANPAVTSARLRVWDRRGHETVTDMVAVPPETNLPGRCFAVTRPAVLTGFRYRIHAGDALTRYFTVRVAIPPVIEHLDVRCRYPDYSRLGVTQARDGSGTIRALAGSEVTVSATVNKPVSSAVMRVTTPSATNTIPGAARPAAAGVIYDFALTLPRQLNGSWTLTLVDEIGLTNAPFDHAIQSIPDTPPVTAVVNLRQREIHLNRDARLPVAYSAEDDLGLTGLALVFTVAGASNETLRALPLPAQATNGVKAMQGETQIAMDDPLFAGAPRLTLRLRATDNLPGTLGGPQSGHSDTYTIILDEQAASWKEQVLTSQEDRARQGLKDVQQKLASARDQARALDATLAQPAALKPDTARKVDTLQDALASADKALHDVAEDVDHGFFTGLATNLAALAEDHVSKAENLTGQLRLVDSPAERTTINSNVMVEIDTSLHAVECAIKDHDIARAAVRRAVELDQLADKQATLAQTRQEQEHAPSPAASNAAAVAGTAAASNAWQRAQDQVADELAALARATPGTAEHVAAATSNLTVQAARQATELAARQTELAALTRQETDHLRDQDRQWRELATRQDQLSVLARREPLSAPQATPMQQAARDLAAGNTEPALRTQAEVAEAMRQDAARLLATPAPAQPAADPTQDDPGRTAADALQKADEGVALARQAVEHAAQAAERAQKRADVDAALAKRADAAQKPDLVRELTAQAAQSRQAAKEARPWRQIAEQAAEQARRAATETRKAAGQAARADQPEPARRDAAAQASHAAEQVREYADNARAAAHQAALQSVERGSLPERAVQAGERALQAVRDARHSALKAGASAEQTRQDAEQARTRADQALANAAPPQQLKEAAAKAADALAQAKAAAAAAEKSRTEAMLARQEAQAAQQAADKALWEASPKAARENAEAAETSSQAAQQAAWRAAEQARLAGEATQAPRTPAERAARSAQAAAQQAADAEQAAAAARKAAHTMAKTSAEARRLAEQAWETGQNDLAQSTGQKASRVREQTERVNALADTVQTLAAEARQAANAAAEAGKTPAALTEPDRAARQAEQAAQLAEAKAEQARTLADQARAATGPAPTAASAANDAQQAAQQAQDASKIAQQAAQSAQQALQKARGTAQPSEQQDVHQTQQAAQQAQQAAQAAQQAALAAQQAARQSRPSGSAATPQATHQAGQEAEQAALRALEKAQEAADAAVTANASANRAHDRMAALQLSRLAEEQEALHREASRLLAQGRQAENALRTGQVEPLAPPPQAPAIADRPLQALQAQQNLLSRRIDDLARAAKVIRAQTDQVLAPTAAGAQAAQAARELAQAAQSAEKAARQMQAVAAQGDAADKPPAQRSAAPTAASPDQAEQTRQAQQSAAQNLTQAAQSLQNAAHAMAAPAPPATTPRPPPAAPMIRESLAKAYEDARQAAASGQAADAAQTATQVAQAADQAAAEALALGANARPATLQTAAPGGGGQPQDAQASEDIPSFARRLGMQLQDWLRLHGELKEDILQASGSEGPEEYRPLIKRYFREVSGHGEEK